MVEALARHRLVTVTGPAGIGKTRLALEVAASLVDVYPAGVWLAELSGSTGRAVESVGPEALLLLDGADTMHASAVERIQTARRHSPGPTFLATARAPLGAGPEEVRPLGPLAFPDPAELPPLDALRQYDAIRLFLDRAAAVRDDFVLDHDNAGAVATLCARLEGVPAAIESAASRLRALTPAQLAARAGSAALSGPGGPAPPG